jgi:hypothetical protein
MQELVKPEDAKHSGTRPADLKRYLRPLLKQRSDLVLIGRLLIIRPVRHIVRGVFFDRTSDKYQFRLRLIVRLLVEPGDNVFLGGEIDTDQCRVWEPEFLALLFHVLEQDVFSELANVRSLADVDRDLGLGREQKIAGFGTTVRALILAGRRERASELMDRFEAQPGNKESQQTWARHQRAFLDRDAASLGIEARSWEAKVAKVYRLGAVWEPSPFPIEVPQAEREHRCDDPPFPARPWIAPPPGLVNAPPTQPGEVRFASKSLRRRSGLVLVVALTREEAAERHRTRQDYVLAGRLPDNNLLVVRHRTWWSPHDPEQPRNPHYIPSRRFLLEVYGTRGRWLQAGFSKPLDRDDVLEMGSLTIFEPVDQGTIWYASNDIDERIKSIHDYRAPPYEREKRQMTDADLSLCVFPEPGFGGLNELWQRAHEYLQREGSGILVDNGASG